MSTSDIRTSGTEEDLEASSELPNATIPARMTMDPDGDLILRVGSGPTAEITEFQVCSAALRRNSPVFKTMLYGSWMESKPPENSENQWVVNLPDDDRSGMEIILDIVHGNFDRVQAAPEPLVLYNVVVIADKYDMVKCLRPWASDWRKEVVRRFGESCKPLLVHVAWELGDETSYVKGVRDLACRSCLDLGLSEPTVSGDGTNPTVWFRRSMKLEGSFDPLYPSSRCGPLDIAGECPLERLRVQRPFELTQENVPSITDVIRDYRRKDIQELLDFFHNQVMGRTAPQGDGSSSSGHACRFLDDQLCDATILGNIWRGMLRNGRGGLFPKLAEEVPQESPFSLLSVFSASFTMPPREDWREAAFHHDECSPQGAFKEIDDRLCCTTEWRSRLLRDYEKGQMAKRRQVLGLDLGDSD